MAEGDQQTGNFPKPKEHTPNIEAKWFKLRDRDTVLRDDGIRTHRATVEKRKIAHQILDVSVLKRDLGQKKFRYERVTYATKVIVSLALHCQARRLLIWEDRTDPYVLVAIPRK